MPPGSDSAARWWCCGPLSRRAVGAVAIDMTTDEVALVADTPQELHDKIQAQGLRNVAILRAPTEDESLFVGPG
ncbi:MAG TPA: hypothetical protein VGA13_02520 [Acidimicrobiales bacterium]